MGTFALVALALVLFVLLAAVAYFITIYNGLVTVRENIKKAWGNIDVILKQRHDELPKLISVCESYAEFEKGMLDRVMQARENYFRAGTVAQKAQASNQISDGLKSIFALAENFPQLKTNENFLQLQNRISSLEESLSDRREFYNDSVNNYNIRIQQIPDNIVAGILGYRNEEMFKASEAERADVNVKIKLPKF